MFISLICFSSSSSYCSQEFDNDIFPITNQSSLSPLEYVQMMRDVLCIKKNLCLCRNFSKLNKIENKSKKYIDVWPVNFLHPGDNDAFDTTSLFMMQLACIVNMVPIWSKLKLRVCVCDETRLTYFSINSVNQSHSERLKNLLKNLRIAAELFPVNGWTNTIETHSSGINEYLNR